MKLTLSEIASLLDLPIGMVERWIKQGSIPIRRSGSSCYFKESVLKKWSQTHNLPFLTPEESHQKTDKANSISLLSAMEFGGIFHEIPGKDVEEVLRNIVSINTFLDEDNKELLLERLIERENLTSTGIGNGVAIPHPRSPLDDVVKQPAISTCFLQTPIDFKAIDDKPVFVIFLLISTSVKNHLQLLSKLSFCIRDNSFVDFLRSVPTAEMVMEKIEMVESLENQ